MNNSQQSVFPKWRPSWTTRNVLDNGYKFYTLNGSPHTYINALRNSSSGFIARKDVRQHIFSRDNKQCRLCGSTDDLNIDHIISVANCVQGFISVELLNGEANLQTLCSACNLKKKHL